MEAHNRSGHFFKGLSLKGEDVFLAAMASLAASFLFASPGFAASCIPQADAIFTAKASGPEVDRLRVEYTGRERRNGKEPADLQLTLFRGKDCVAQCRSTQPLNADALETIDFRCSSTALSALGSLATLRINERSLQLGSFLQGYRSYRLEAFESRLGVLSQTLRIEEKREPIVDTFKTVAAGQQRTSPRENQ